MVKTRQLFPTTLVELERDVENLQFFSVENGLLTEGRHTNDYHNAEIRTIHMDTLRTIDSRLPRLVDALIARVRDLMERPDLNEFFGGTFRDTLRLWTQARIAKTVNYGNIVYRDFEHIDFIEKNDTHVVASVLVRKCQIESIQDEGGQLSEIVTSTRSFLCDLDPVWLDEVFPGWLMRYSVAEALGTEGKALVDYVFPHQPQSQPTVQLPLVDDISFE